MERLTAKKDERESPHFTGFLFANEQYEKMYKKLAAYEDIGFMPERVAELAKAEAEGRLVVLPCKVGQSLFGVDYYTNNWVNPEIYLFTARNEGWICARREEFGKNYFFTREEAEAALAAGKGDI
jgi:hypothetical protein